MRCDTTKKYLRICSGTCLVAPEWLERGGNHWNALPLQQENAKTGFWGAHFVKRRKPKQPFDFFSFKFLLFDSLLPKVFSTDPIHSFFFYPVWSILNSHLLSSKTSFLKTHFIKNNYSLIQTATTSIINSSFV